MPNLISSFQADPVPAVIRKFGPELPEPSVSHLQESTQKKPTVKKTIELFRSKILENPRFFDFHTFSRLENTLDELNAKTVQPSGPFSQNMRMIRGEQLIVKGDIHGDLQTLINYLEDLQEQGKLNCNFQSAEGVHLAFLGDYMDKGQHNFEVMEIIAKLKSENPDNIHLIRGNHEDVAVNKKSFKARAENVEKDLLLSDQKKDPFTQAAAAQNIKSCLEIFYRSMPETISVHWSKSDGGPPQKQKSALLAHATPLPPKAHSLSPDCRASLPPEYQAALRICDLLATHETFLNGQEWAAEKKTSLHSRVELLRPKKEHEMGFDPSQLIEIDEIDKKKYSIRWPKEAMASCMLANSILGSVHSDTLIRGHEHRIDRQEIRANDLIRYSNHFSPEMPPLPELSEEENKKVVTMHTLPCGLFGKYGKDQPVDKYLHLDSSGIIIEQTRTKHLHKVASWSDCCSLSSGISSNFERK
ncbi:MAG: hypothetical protein ACI9S8_001908 [Chlamydiales bacterium]|jgi:hypothetical protein